MSDPTSWDALFERQAPTAPVVGVVPLDGDRMTRYAAAALSGEVANVLAAGEGTRNDTLNRAGFALAQLIASGHLDERTVRDELTNAGLAAGLDPSEVAKTLGSSLGAGKDHPRVVGTLPATVAAPAQSVDPFGEGYVAPTDGQTVASTAPSSSGGQEESPGGDSDDLVATWSPVDLEAILTGTYVPEEPRLFPRTDGACLLYPGRVHSFHGESESGKSLVAQSECARLMAEGLDVLFIDFESDAAAVVARMRELGASTAEIREHFTYLRPESDPRKFAHERKAITAVLSKPYALAVVDGVTDALGIFGASSKDNDEVSAFMRLLPRAVARLTGAAVVLVDHVSKDADSRGRFAIGGQAKMAALDGAAYVVEIVEAIGQGMRGVITLRIAKDRPGGVRARSGHYRRTDRTQESARVVVDSTVDPHVILIAVEEPKNVTESDDDFRPTHMMEKVSRALEGAAEAMSGRSIADLRLGKAETVRQALAYLVRDGFVTIENGPRNAQLHSSAAPFREGSDPFGSDLENDRVRPRPDRVPDTQNECVPRPPSPKEGDALTNTHSRGRPRPSDPDALVGCAKCFRPTTWGAAEKRDGLCAECAGAGS